MKSESIGSSAKAQLEKYKPELRAFSSSTELCMIKPKTSVNSDSEGPHSWVVLLESFCSSKVGEGARLARLARNLSKGKCVVKSRYPGPHKPRAFKRPFGTVAGTVRRP